MLIHLRPRMFAPGADVTLIDISIEPFGLCLRHGVDVKLGHPYRNKGYTVASRKRGQKAVDGILIEVPKVVKQFEFEARWACNGRVLNHFVTYVIKDAEFDAVSEDMALWYAYSPECGGWADRHPPGWKFDDPPTQNEPVMQTGPSLPRWGPVLDLDLEDGTILARWEIFEMPTLERERVLRGNRSFGGRTPKIEDAFRL